MRRRRRAPGSCANRSAVEQALVQLQDEAAQLRASLSALQQTSDDKLEMGQMQWALMQARQGEGDAKRQLAAGRARLHHAQAALYKHQLLLDGKDQQLFDSQQSKHALETALRLDDLESSATLLEAGAAVDAMAGGGDETLLHLVAACDSERSAVELAASRQKVELLLRYGASVNAQNGRGESPLDVALFGPAPPLVQERTPPHVPHCRYPRYATLISIFVACTRLIPRAAPARARRRVVDGNRGGRLCAARGGAGRPPRSPARGTRRW